MVGEAETCLTLISKISLQRAEVPSAEICVLPRGMRASKDLGTAAARLGGLQDNSAGLSPAQVCRMDTEISTAQSQ